MIDNFLETSPILLESDIEEPITQSGILMDESVISIEDLTDETASLDLIAELKLTGFKKPPGISNKHWNGAPELSHRQTMAIQLAASGVRASVIARELKSSSGTINSWLRDPIIKAEIRAAQDTIYGKDTRKRLEGLATKAVDKLEDVLENSIKEQTTLQAATYIIDQAVGKSKQDIELKTTLLIDMMKKIEEMPKQSRILSKMEQLAINVIPEAITVGKRNEG